MPEGTVAAAPAGRDALRSCPCCGYVSRLPALSPGHVARCPCCDTVLRRKRRDSLDLALMLNLSASLFYVLAVFAPLMVVSLNGQERLARLTTGPAMLSQEGLPFLGMVVLAFTVAAPLVKLGVSLAVLLGLRLDPVPRWLYRPMRYLERLSPWAMVEVYLLGLAVAYTRLVALVHVELDSAAYALVGLMLLMVAADAALDPAEIWEKLDRAGATPPPVPRATDRAGAPGLVGCHVCHKVNLAHSHESCDRCGGTLHHRKPRSIALSWSLLGVATMMYVPANLYSVMNVTRLGRTQPHTILGGAQDLLDAGLWPLALLVFFASITVPVLKLFSLALMLSATARRDRGRLLDRTRLYRLVVFIGRWSMIDVFMISILVGLVHFGQLANITSGMGAVAFACVVMLTMVASETFDPRLMWDAARQGRPTREKRHRRGWGGNAPPRRATARTPDAA